MHLHSLPLQGALTSPRGFARAQCLSELHEALIPALIYSQLQRMLAAPCHRIIGLGYSGDKQAPGECQISWVNLREAYNKVDRVPEHSAAIKDNIKGVFMVTPLFCGIGSLGTGEVVITATISPVRPVMVSEYPLPLRACFLSGTHISVDLSSRSLSSMAGSCWLSDSYAAQPTSVPLPQLPVSAFRDVTWGPLSAAPPSFCKSMPRLWHILYSWGWCYGLLWG